MNPVLQIFQIQVPEPRQETISTPVSNNPRSSIARIGHSMRWDATYRDNDYHKHNALDIGESITRLYSCVFDVGLPVFQRNTDADLDIFIMPQTLK